MTESRRRMRDLKDVVGVDSMQKIRTPPTSTRFPHQRGDDEPLGKWSIAITPGSTRCPTVFSKFRRRRGGATQDSFLTLYRKIGTFDESKKFFSWFYRVALNQAYSRARRRKPVCRAD